MTRTTIICAVVFTFLIAAQFVEAQTLVRDIAPNAESSNPAGLVNIDGTVYFSASDPDHGEELWISRGTLETTHMLVDINPGSPGSAPSEFTPFDAGFYFTADDGSTGRELWWSDGSAAGTRRVVDLNPGPDGSWPQSLLVLGEDVFFLATGGLWRSDGTADGTTFVAPANFVWNASEVGIGARQIVPVDGKVVFTRVDEWGDSDDREYILWKTDGTTTELVARTRVRADLSLDTGCWLKGGSTTGKQAFFTFNCYSWSKPVIATDGTGVGTRQIGGWTYPDCYFCRLSAVTPLPAIARVTYFVNQQYEDALEPSELYAFTEGANDAVRLGAFGARGTEIRYVAATKQELFFLAGSGRDIYDMFVPAELWRTDGTVGGTVLVRDTSAPPNANGLTTVPPFFFAADDGVHGNELWMSDGTSAGTVLVADLNPTSDSSNPADFEALDGMILFGGDDGEIGRELWRIRRPTPPLAGACITAPFDEPGSRAAVNKKGTDGRLVGPVRQEVHGDRTVLNCNPPGFDTGHVRFPYQRSCKLNSQLTVAFWAYAQPSYAGDPMVGAEQNGAWRLLKRSKGPLSTWVAEISEGWTGKRIQVETDAPIASGEWHHVALTFDGSKLKIYVDGERRGLTTVAHTRIAQVTAGTDVCRRDNTRYFHGKIDDFYVFNKRLSIHEVRMLMDGSAVLARREAPAESLAETGAQEVAAETPTRFALENSYPNPFNPSTTIAFAVPETAPVTLAVFDLLGRHVQTLTEGMIDAGRHEVTFDASGLPSGIYLVRMDTPQSQHVQKITLLK